MTLRAVIFDVDFTLAKPGPELGPDGYVRLAERYGLTLDPSRYHDARVEAFRTLERHPELAHDEEMWVLFTERIIRGMGGDGAAAYEVAVEMTRWWEHAHNFELYDDVLPVLEALSEQGLLLGLISNTARDLDEFVAHHGLAVDHALASRAHGYSKPHRSIFEAALAALAVGAQEAVMVGDSIEDDIEGAAGVGMRGILIDRAEQYPDRADALPDLLALPAALGLRVPS